MLENQVADDQIGGLVLAWPAFRNVGNRAFDVGVVSKFCFRLSKHVFGEIKGMDSSADAREKGCILSRAASDFDDVGKTRRG